jgi:hypothetical protein
MQRIGLLLVFAACGGGGEGGGDVWSVRVSQFASTACQNPCVPTDFQVNCTENIAANLDSNRFSIQDEDACIACLRAKTQVVDQLVANDCEMSAAVEASLALSCDLDPENDFDFDGDPANDLEESCLGAGAFPFGELGPDLPQE